MGSVPRVQTKSFEDDGLRQPMVAAVPGSVAVDLLLFLRVGFDQAK